MLHSIVKLKVKKEDIQKLDEVMEAPVEETLESDKTEESSIDEANENTTIEDKKEEK